MKHCGTRTIETERLILRRFTIEDAACMYKNWASDEAVVKYLTWPVHENENATKEILKPWVESYKEDNYYQWAIVLKEIDEPIGSISAVGMKESIDMVHIGYCIGSPWWHQGITSESLKAIIEFFFDKVGVNRIEARHDPRNPHSGMVMKKCGMKYEGTMRSADKNNQGICDACWYSILKSDITD
ncbi:GNAT family N-acetyltransferase [Butyrivibrio sp. VCD2006]|uniref:GNAT family N-acetyltransferase n=1 Tax=Butyrivibrio sp. VCD2006 TaxID=1280664 RepID=UPI0003FAA960|nr:GNAT family N-acetyltransferase [Butyrivibrio sp. VCD2006]